MRTRSLGSSAIDASVIGFGAWAIGGGQVWGNDSDDSESIHAIKAALDVGINLIDTAPAYGWGRSERLVGEAIRGRRHEVILATKCGLWWDDERGSYFCEFDGKPLHRSVRPDTIQIEIENSLKRLGTDQIDLYQVHWPSIPPEQTPISETMEALLKLKEQGKIRAIGVSNVSIPELAEYLRAGAVASCQFRYSMLFRDSDKDLIPFCAEHQLATLTYMSLEQGLLTGKVGMDRIFKPTEFRCNDAWNPWFVPHNRRRVLELLAGWNDLLEKYGCSLSQLVLAWTLAQRGVTHVLCGARSPRQVQENARGAELLLSPGDLSRMRSDLEQLGPPEPEPQLAAA